MMATGGGGVEVDRIGVRAQRLDQHVVDDLDDHLAGRDGLHDVGADGAGAHLVGERAHHVERHVGFEQRAADFAHGGVDVLLGERAAPRQLVEYAGELFGKAFEHAFILGWRPARNVPKPTRKARKRPGAHRAAGRWPPDSRDR